MHILDLCAVLVGQALAAGSVEIVMSDNKSTWASIWSAVLALLALPISVVSVVFASHNDDRLQEQADRLDRQETQQFASKVYIGEVPQYVYDEYGPRVGRPPVWSVINASGIQVDDVWVEGKDGRSVRLGAVQRCTIYTFRKDFAPAVVYFTDPFGEWNRPVERPLAVGRKATPADPSAESQVTVDLRNCAG